MIDLFKDIVPKERLHKSYVIIRDSSAHQGVRKLLNEVYNSIKAIDNDFVVQFQTNGFDSRIWELCLLAGFQEQRFNIIRSHDRPDFQLEKNMARIYVEAVTSNPAFNAEIENKMDFLRRLKDEELDNFIFKLRAESTIRIAGALSNKLKQEYWKLPWVAGYPIVIAVEPFHHSLVHMLSDSNVVGYLYGFDNSWFYDKDEKLIINTNELKTHEFNGKTIPSNFFSLENSEYISAVVFSNSGTISKFTRLAKLKGYIDKQIKIVRKGFKYDHNPNSAYPLTFAYSVGEEGPLEDWVQGMCMYHNPNAKYPIDRNLFPGMLHGYNDDGFYVFYPEFWPVQSETNIIVPESYLRKDSK